MFKKKIIPVLVILVAFSCTYDTLEVKKPDSLVIKTGTICGWCAVNDTLTINGNLVRYVNYTKCNNSAPTVEKAGQILTSELDALVAKLDFAALKKLDLNSCNVCADGCDDWIYFKNGLDSHYIRFGKSDPKLQSIQAFVDQLNVIKSQYSTVK